jgi:hypothetical protein
VRDFLAKGRESEEREI